MSEKRREERIHYTSEAIITCGDKTTGGKIENLSTKGMFLVTEDRFPVESPVTIQVILSGATSELTINIAGTVERIDSNGMGIQFEEMELDSYTHLKNIINYANDRANELQ